MRALALALVLAGAPAARAHLGPPEGRMPFVDESGALSGGGTTWGVVRKQGERWLRTCEEALGGPPDFYLVRPSDGRILVAQKTVPTGATSFAPGKLFVTDDGCTRDDGPAALDGKGPTLAAQARLAPDVIYIASGLSDGENALFKSSDGGESFAVTALAGVNASLRTLVVSDDGLRVYVSAMDLETHQSSVHFSLDGGASFAQATPWSGAVTGAFVRGIDEETGEVAIVVVGEGQAGSTVMLAPAELSSATPLADFASVVTGLLVFQGAYLVTDATGRYRRREKSGAEFAEIDEGPSRCLLRLPGDERVWGCGQPFEGGHFMVSDDGVVWSTLMPHLVVEEERCPAGTLGAEKCAYLFGDAGPVVERDAGASGDGDGDGGGAFAERPGEEPGCPCTSARGGGDLALLACLGALFTFTRRRRRGTCRR